MKVLVFADSNWSVGRVHRDVLKYIKNIEFTYIDWANYNWDHLIQQVTECDVCLTNIVSIAFFRNSNIPIDYKKCVFMSHGYIDNNATKFDDLTDEWVYGITSESILCLFPENRKIFLMPNGVEPSHFQHKERNGSLNILGWCGAQEVSSKQAHWAHEIAERCSLPISFGSNMSFEQICDWYSSIDVLLITSGPNQTSETGPLPAFEAIVSGVPVIGTPVGNFQKIPGPKFTTVEEGIEIVNRLKSDPTELRDIARLQYEYVMNNFTYEHLAPKWREGLEYVYLRSKGEV